jgi:hypothetical protein
VASLTDAAATARHTAIRLRVDAEALKFVARRAVERSREQTAACTRTVRKTQTRTRYAGSPWSSLPWRTPTAELLRELDRVLDPL